MAANAFSQSGSITNIQVAQRTDGSGLVDVYFTLDGSGNSYFMNLRVSFDAGTNYYPVSRSTISGNIGPLSPGSGKHIVWDPTIDHPNRYSPQTKLMVIAFTAESTNPCPGAPHVIDYDGNYYNTVQIGDQCWMKEDLKTTRDCMGNAINRNCYGNDPGYCELYGGLYNWGTMMNGSGGSNSNPSGVQGICPNGWHLPSDSEWTELTNYLINTHVDINAGNLGNKLKSCRQIGSPLNGECNTTDHPRWNPDATNYGTNDFGFSGLPGTNSLYSNQWWSTTIPPGTTGYAFFRQIDNSTGGVNYTSAIVYDNYFSVRCIKD